MCSNPGTRENLQDILKVVKFFLIALLPLEKFSAVLNIAGGNLISSMKERFLNYRHSRTTELSQCSSFGLVE